MIEGWLDCKLGDLFEFKNGINADKSAYGDGVPFVNVMDVFGNDILVADIIRGKMYADPKQIETYSVMRGDVLFNRTSETFDEVAMSAVYLDDAEAVFGGFVIRARPKDNRLDPHFCAYFFRSDTFRKELIRRGQGAVRANIGQKDLATVPAIVPPLYEQKHIAEIFSTWDQAIEATEKLIAISEAQKKALRQQLLTRKKRLPGFEGAWQNTPLSTIADIKKGKQKSKDTLTETGDYPVINGGIEPSGYAEEFNTPADTITISEGGNSCGFVNLIKTKFWSGGHCYTLENLKADRDYLFHVLKWLEPNIMRLRVGSGLPNIQKGAISNLDVPLPELREQKKIAEHLNVQRSIELGLEADLQAIKVQKSALMQQLLTGKRRVKIEREDAADA